MLVGIISDTHDKRAPADEALHLLRDRKVRQLVHCGDWTTPDTMRVFIETAARLDILVYGVLGNNDREVAAMLELSAQLPFGQRVVEGILEFELAGKAFAAYHGHHRPTLNRLLGAARYDAVFLGHSHKPRAERLANGLHVINPGSTAFAIPRRKGWQASVVIYDTVGDEAEFIYF